jgi:hypothetical protein
MARKAIVLAIFVTLAFLTLCQEAEPIIPEE